MAKKELSLLEKEYRKQRRRLKQIKRRAEKEGYFFQSDPLPSKPKKVTQASVNRLARITPTQIREKGKHYNKETGEIKTSKQWQREKKQIQKQQREIRKKERNLIKQQEQKIEEPFNQESKQTLPFEKVDDKHYVDDNDTVINVEDLKDLIKTEKSNEEQQKEYIDVEKFGNITKVGDTFVDENGVIISNEQVYSEDEIYENFDSHIISQYREYLSTLPPVFKEPLLKFLENVLSIFGEQRVAQGLNDIDETIWDVYDRMRHKYMEAIITYTQRLLDFIPQFDEEETKIINRTPLTVDVLKNNAEFLTKYEYEDLEYVL